MLEVYTHYDPPAETNVPGIIYLPRLPVMDMTPLPPCQLFDDLFFIGTTFVGVLVVKTTDGLVLIDSMNCRRDVEDILFPGMRTLGLKPEDIRAVLVTHGHFDHFGGAAAIHEMTGCQVLMSEIDAAFMRVCPLLPEEPPEFPTVTRFVGEGDHYVCGETDFLFSFTPGHTPGGLSLIFPVHDNGQRHMVSLWGGINPPRDKEGCQTYANSAEAFTKLSLAHGCDVEFSVHPFVDYSIDKMRNLAQKRRTVHHPLVIGQDGVALFMRIVRLTAEQMLENI